MKGFAFTFGAAFEPNEQWTVGLTVRPPFALDIDCRAGEPLFGRRLRPRQDLGELLSRKQPFVAVGSVRFRPEDRFELTADVSFWGWSGAASDYGSSWATLGTSRASSS